MVRETTEIALVSFPLVKLVVKYTKSRLVTL